MNAMQQKISYKVNNKIHLQVIAEGEGELIVVRRPAERMPGYHFIPCTKCLGFFNVNSIGIHRKCCPLVKKNEIWEPRNSKREGLLLVTPSVPRIIDLDKIVLTGMKETRENCGECIYYFIIRCCYLFVLIHRFLYIFFS